MFFFNFNSWAMSITQGRLLGKFQITNHKYKIPLAAEPKFNPPADKRFGHCDFVFGIYL
jgi:hypothetical protein